MININMINSIQKIKPTNLYEDLPLIYRNSVQSDCTVYQQNYLQ